jgi:hypothetical protein
MTETPILFLIFNRPETSYTVFDAIRKAKPKRLYVAADGPRNGNENDQLKCIQTRAVINVDWDCEVKLLFRTENLGCKNAVSQAITWFFEQEEQGIILEDDCLPHPSFFPYCEALLNYYKNEERVMLISGDNFQKGKTRGEASYYFSQYSHIWGWASWRRAWKNYDVNMSSYPTFIEENRIASIFKNKGAQRYWLRKLEKTYQKGVNTWDYQWTYTIWNQGGVTILPNVNLISNIGYETGGTHTNVVDNDMANLPVKEMIFPLTHPKTITPDALADKFTYNTLFKKTLLKNLKLLPYISWSELIFKKRK